jgi:hypothetical protein
VESWLSYVRQRAGLPSLLLRARSRFSIIITTANLLHDEKALTEHHRLNVSVNTSTYFSLDTARRPGSHRGGRGTVLVRQTAIETKACHAEDAKISGLVPVFGQSKHILKHIRFTGMRRPDTDKSEGRLRHEQMRDQTRAVMFRGDISGRARTI